MPGIDRSLWRRKRRRLSSTPAERPGALRKALKRAREVTEGLSNEDVRSLRVALRTIEQQRMNPARLRAARLRAQRRRHALKQRKRIADLLGIELRTPAQLRSDRKDIVRRSFDVRAEALKDAYTMEQVAQMLRIKPQSVHERYKTGSLVALKEGRELRFPVWQFDPEAPKGIVPDLRRVVKALSCSPLAKILWLTRPNPGLGGRTPVEALKAGQAGEVVAAARAVGTT